MHSPKNFDRSSTNLINDADLPDNHEKEGGRPHDSNNSQPGRMPGRNSSSIDCIAPPDDCAITTASEESDPDAPMLNTEPPLPPPFTTTASLLAPAEVSSVQQPDLTLMADCPVPPALTTSAALPSLPQAAVITPDTYGRGTGLDNAARSFQETLAAIDQDQRRPPSQSDPTPIRVMPEIEFYSESDAMTLPHNVEIIDNRRFAIVETPNNLITGNEPEIQNALNDTRRSLQNDVPVPLFAGPRLSSNDLRILSMEHGGADLDNTDPTSGILVFRQRGKYDPLYLPPTTPLLTKMTLRDKQNTSEWATHGIDIDSAQNTEHCIIAVNGPGENDLPVRQGDTICSSFIRSFDLAKNLPISESIALSASFSGHDQIDGANNAGPTSEGETHVNSTQRPVEEEGPRWYVDRLQPKPKHSVKQSSEDCFIWDLFCCSRTEQQ